MEHSRERTGRLVLVAMFLTAIPGPGGAADHDSSDEAVESFLLNAEVIGIRKMLPGSTYPMALDLRLGGSVRQAAFKYRPADLEDSSPTDRFQHEVAAYRLDRLLGLDMVPVAVIRNVHAEGAVIEWISEAFTEQKLRERGEYPRDPQLLIEQQAVMILFDALILNEDRKESDQLITTGDWKLHLVDHSRAFQTSTEMPPSFLSQPASLSRSLLRRLVLLNTESLGDALEGLLSDAQIEAMLERRTKILEKVAADREKYGDARVFQKQAGLTP